MSCELHMAPAQGLHAMLLVAQWLKCVVRKDAPLRLLLRKMVAELLYPMAILVALWWQLHDGLCALVAREFRGYAKTTSETIAPTSGVGSRLVLLLHVCIGWCLSFCGIRDVC